MSNQNSRINQAIAEQFGWKDFRDRGGLHGVHPVLGLCEVPNFYGDLHEAWPLMQVAGDPHKGSIFYHSMLEQSGRMSSPYTAPVIGLFWSKSPEETARAICTAFLYTSGVNVAALLAQQRD